MEVTEEASSLSNELESLKIVEGCTVKVIENVGEFKSLITVRCKKPTFTLKFQIIEDYPSTSPECIFLTSAVSKSRTADVQTALFAANLGRKKNHIIGAYNTAKEKLENIIEANFNLKNTKKKKNVHKSKQKTKPTASELDSHGDLLTEKKASMKTALDVVNRILWDEAIEKDSITLGYVDRFRGILEKPFFAFSWEDIACIDYYTFAVPKHRIEYFKYRRAVVWDKQSRLDNVFGSLGSGLTITDVIASYRDEDYPLKEGEELPTVDRFAGFHDNNENEDSEDDGIEIVLSSGAKAGYVRSSSVALSQDEGEEEEPEVEKEEEEKSYWRDKCRPNFFVCIRIANPDIAAVAVNIQDMVCDQEPRYEDCCVSDKTLHVTLCTLRLDNAEQVAECIQAIHSSEEELRNLLPKTPIRLRGLGRFHGRVLYGKAEVDADFFTFVNHLETCLRASGMRLTDNHEFVPHMSLVKVTRPVTRLIGSKNISPLLYHGSEDVVFGDQIVDSIYLCSMEKTRGPDGFYVTPGSLTFMKHVL